MNAYEKAVEAAYAIVTAKWEAIERRQMLSGEQALRHLDEVLADLHAHLIESKRGAEYKMGVLRATNLVTDRIQYIRPLGSYTGGQIRDHLALVLRKLQAVANTPADGVQAPELPTEDTHPC